MARATRVFTTKAVADRLDEDIELIEEITSNPDNIDYGEMLHIYDGSEDGATGFTDRGVQCIEEMLDEARNWNGGLRGFLRANHSEPEAIERIMAKEQARIKTRNREKR